MRIDRKAFLRLTGLSLLALTGKKVISAVAGTAQAGKAQTRPAKRWAMVIDIKKCLQDSGCTRCIEACHVTHNVPEFKDRDHEVKWIWKEPFEHVFPPEGAEYTLAAFRDTPLPVFCNHCDDPPCVRVCPTQATWRREDGIVMMDWHRCIGCRYCMAACPYGSRSFNWFDPRPRIAQLNLDFPTRTRGVVEKCNFCEERLAQGQAAGVRRGLQGESDGLRRPGGSGLGGSSAAPDPLCHPPQARTGHQTADLLLGVRHSHVHV